MCQCIEISPKERGRIYKALKPIGSSHLLPRRLNTVAFVFALDNIENTRTYSPTSRIRSMKGEKGDARYGLSWTNIRCEIPQPSRQNLREAMHDGGLRFLLANEVRATSLPGAIVIVGVF